MSRLKLFLFLLLFLFTVTKAQAASDSVGPQDDIGYADSGQTPGGPNLRPVNPRGWQLQLLDTRGLTGRYPAIAVDSHRYPHIIQTKVLQLALSNHHLIEHIYWDGVRWHKETIDTVYSVGERIAFTIDGYDKPHVAYAVPNGPNKGLYYAYWDGNVWQKQQIESNHFLPTISLDVNSWYGTIHVAYAVTQPTKQFVYAKWDGAAWQKETIDQSAIMTKGYTGIAVTTGYDARPYIAYYHEADQELKRAYIPPRNPNNPTPTWITETIDANANFVTDDHFFSIDGDFNPDIVYYKDGGQKLVISSDIGWINGEILTLNSPDRFTGNVALSRNGGVEFHVAYSRYKDPSTTDIYVAHMNPVIRWDHTLIDNSGSGREGQQLDIAYGVNGKPFIAYKDMVHSDLRFASFERSWQIRTIPDPGQTASVDIQLKGTMPYLSYYNLASNFVNLAHWDTKWDISPADAVNTLVPQTSLAISHNSEHVSYYDADTQDLIYARHQLSGWSRTVVESEGDVGRFNQILLPHDQSPNPYIVYWDETNRQIKLAVHNSASNTFTIHTNWAAPTLPPGSGPLSATIVDGENVGIVYYEANTSGLRYAVWLRQNGNWIDEIVDNFPGKIGRLNSVQTDDICACPVIAYYNETSDTLQYAQRINGVWQREVVTANAGGVTDLSLELGLNSRMRPRISYTTANAANFAYKKNGLWQFETIADGVANPNSTALALDVRPHVAYPDVLDGLQYAFRTATLDVEIAAPGLTEMLHAAKHPFAPCGVWYRMNLCSMEDTGDNIRSNFSEETSLKDEAIYAGLLSLFNQTGQGQAFIELYFIHAPEIAQIGLNDPHLLWDGYGALQNFLPGLEALVTGNGDQYMVTQEMVDDALNIWKHLADAGSPELADAINTQLAQYNDLQDFVDRSFDDWAVAIGVEPPKKANNTIHPSLASSKAPVIQITEKPGFDSWATLANRKTFF